jgi:ArsR family transcriptional regulator, arsenate/arsenite/antimonite-responsive transcriptional repressor
MSKPVEQLKALADPIRLAIVQKLAQRSELCACNLLEDFAISQPTLSFHMKKLTTCGVVLARKDGIWIKYRLNPDVMNELITTLSMKSDPDNDGCSCSS